MSKDSAFGLMRTAIVVLLLSGSAVCLTGCPEKSGEPPAHDAPDNHKRGGMGGGMMGGSM